MSNFNSFRRDFLRVGSLGAAASASRRAAPGGAILLRAGPCLFRRVCRFADGLRLPPGLSTARIRFYPHDAATEAGDTSIHPGCRRGHLRAQEITLPGQAASYLLSTVGYFAAHRFDLPARIFAFQPFHLRTAGRLGRLARLGSSIGFDDHFLQAQERRLPLIVCRRSQTR